jgi:hypothetical protein
MPKTDREEASLTPGSPHPASPKPLWFLASIVDRDASFAGFVMVMPHFPSKGEIAESISSKTFRHITRRPDKGNLA